MLNYLYYTLITVCISFYTYFQTNNIQGSEIFKQKKHLKMHINFNILNINTNI